MTWPEKGMALLASSPARLPDEVIIRQMFSWTAMSTRIDTRIANANAAPIWAVNVAVWVMKPGPMALVAMRKMAPMTALRPARFFAWAARASSSGVRAGADCSDIGGSHRRWWVSGDPQCRTDRT